jgi:hypothetical protein
MSLVRLSYGIWYKVQTAINKGEKIDMNLVARVAPAILINRVSEFEGKWENDEGGFAY